jgi:hypothetical protein
MGLHSLLHGYLYLLYITLLYFTYLRRYTAVTFNGLHAVMSQEIELFVISMFVYKYFPIYISKFEFLIMCNPVTFQNSVQHIAAECSVQLRSAVTVGCSRTNILVCSEIKRNRQGNAHVLLSSIVTV